MNIFTKNWREITFFFLTIIFCAITATAQGECLITHKSSYCNNEPITFRANCGGTHVWWQRIENKWTRLSWQGADVNLTVNRLGDHLFGYGVTSENANHPFALWAVTVKANCGEDDTCLNELSKRDSIIYVLREALFESVIRTRYTDSLYRDSQDSLYAEKDKNIDCNMKLKDKCIELHDALIRIDNLNGEVFLSSNTIILLEGALSDCKETLTEYETNLEDCQGSYQSCVEKNEELNNQLETCQNDLGNCIMKLEDCFINLSNCSNDTVVVIVDNWQCGHSLTECEQKNDSLRDANADLLADLITTNNQAIECGESLDMLIEENGGLLLELVETNDQAIECGLLVESLENTIETNSCEITTADGYCKIYPITPNPVSTGDSFSIRIEGNYNFLVQIRDESGKLIDDRTVLEGSHQFKLYQVGTFSVNVIAGGYSLSKKVIVVR